MSTPYAQIVDNLMELMLRDPRIRNELTYAVVGASPSSLFGGTLHTTYACINRALIAFLADLDRHIEMDLDERQARHLVGGASTRPRGPERADRRNQHHHARLGHDPLGFGDGELAFLCSVI